MDEDLSFLRNREPNPYTAADVLVMFVYDDGTEFGCGTVAEFEALKATGIIDPAAQTRAM